MKIILVTNQTLGRGRTQCIDGGYYNFYIPLLELGHDVLFYDTIHGADKSFTELVDDFKPDLVFCCITGDCLITPYEPLEEIARITKSNKIKTFNWFCDDTWRFHNFSKDMCKNFTYCSTPEEKFIEKYKEAGYSNILEGNWHCNPSLSPRGNFDKVLDLSFIGGINRERASILDRLRELGLQMQILNEISYEDLFKVYACSKIGFNLTTNSNDPEKKAQMKLRIFEVTAAGALLLTEEVDGLDKFFEIGKEVETFKTIDEAEEKIKYYLKNESAREKIAAAGHQRFLTDHSSKVRLAKLLAEIK